jgi:cob(I)alamin adenosyltransferase
MIRRQAFCGEQEDAELELQSRSPHSKLRRSTTRRTTILASIATKRGDSGETSLVGGVRVSKAALRVETYGTIDELNSAIGFARSITDDSAICASALRIQRELFTVGSLLATPAGSRKGPPPLDPATVETLTAEVHTLEESKEIVFDWSVPGGCPSGAAFDVARTICRRAERCAVRLRESGEDVPAVVFGYLNRLSDLLWLFGRKLEGASGEQSALRALNSKEGNRWSRAW